MKKLLTGFMVALLGLSIVACKPQAQQNDAQVAEQRNVQAQMNVKARATQQVPVPRSTNFQARKNLAEYMKRVDEMGKVWYIYERSRNTGKIIGAYISSSYPQSVCTFMTPPEEIKKKRTDLGQFSGETAHTTTAMALDGVYYKGGSCPEFFFDSVTGAMVVLDQDAVTIAVDKPLNVSVPFIKFKE